MSFRPDAVETFKIIFETNWQRIKGFEGMQPRWIVAGWKPAHHFLRIVYGKIEVHLNAYRDSELFKGVWGATKALFSNKPEARTVKQIDFPAKTHPASKAWTKQ